MRPLLGLQDLRKNRQGQREMTEEQRLRNKEYIKWYVSREDKQNEILLLEGNLSLVDIQELMENK